MEQSCRQEKQAHVGVEGGGGGGGVNTHRTLCLKIVRESLSDVWQT